MLALPADRLTERVARCVGGLAVFGAGIGAIIGADLGLSPWDVFHQGLAQRLGLGIGTVMIAIGALLLLLWIPLRERPGIGTVLNATEVGLVVGWTLQLLPDTDRLAVRVPLLVGGIVAVAVGSGAYIGAGLDPGPRDGLMTGLARRGMSIRAARTGVEVTVLVAGIALGGSVGVGTALFAFGIGPLVQVFLPRLTVGSPHRAGASGTRGAGDCDTPSVQREACSSSPVAPGATAPEPPSAGRAGSPSRARGRTIRRPPG